MTIHELNGSLRPVDPVGWKKSKEAKEEREAASSRADGAELSAEARSLYEAEQAKRFESIQEKIKSGFYFQRDVTEQVVEALLRDLKGP